MALFQCFCCLAFGQTDSLSEAAPMKKVEPKPTRLIYVYPINENAAWLDLKNGGFGLARLFPVKIIGVKAVEEEGFRFTPAKEAPEGMMPQEIFDRFYMFNSLVKGIFIPYSEMKSVKLYYGITIRTNNGKRYHFRCKRPKQLVRDLRSHLKTVNSS